MEWLATNWQYVMVGIFVCEKVVKLTPWPYDDIVLDIVLGALRQMMGGKKMGKGDK